MIIDIENHPCFNDKVRHTYGRVHLPVAARCNVQCKFCSRKYDCVNESRPGVTSTILSPYQAGQYLEYAKDRHPEISVVGIAGPGDPFANSEETMETLRIVRKRFPGIMLCVATNGLDIMPHVEELAGLRVSHVTITINAVDLEIGADIYSWVRYDRHVYRGLEASSILLGRQQESLRMLKGEGITVKVNTIVIPGINDFHVQDVAGRVSELGADILNCIPLYSVEGTPFESISEPLPNEMERIKEEAGRVIPQMNHCRRCRADAVGCIGSDDKEMYGMLEHFAGLAPVPEGDRPYIAVASEEGMLVNRHLGEAYELLIYGKNGEVIEHVDTRKMPPPGGGDNRWLEMAARLNDCFMVLVGGAGDNPRRILAGKGIMVMVLNGLMLEALDGIYNGKNIRHLMNLQVASCGSRCSGSGEGC